MPTTQNYEQQPGKDKEKREQREQAPDAIEQFLALDAQEARRQAQQFGENTAQATNQETRSLLEQYAQEHGGQYPAELDGLQHEVAAAHTAFTEELLDETIGGMHSEADPEADTDRDTTTELESSQEGKEQKALRLAKEITGWYGSKAFELKTFTQRFDQDNRDHIKTYTDQYYESMQQQNGQSTDQFRQQKHLLEHFQSVVSGPGGLNEQVITQCGESQKHIQNLVEVYQQEKSMGKEVSLTQLMGDIQKIYKESQHKMNTLLEQIQQGFDGELPEQNARLLRTEWKEIQKEQKPFREQFHFMNIGWHAEMESYVQQLGEFQR